MAQVPKQIAGRYRVEEVLGRGGMGVVYRAVDEVTGMPCALKELHSHETERGHADHAALLEREYHALSLLAHPRVIEVYEYGIADGRAYYTMELLDGGDLREAAPLPWRTACVILRDVASSLAILHSRRLVHRDVSPRNVRLTRSHGAKLIDFGAMVPFGPAAHVVGTPAYMAPEVVHGQCLDARTDLYSLGALAYWALTGRHAYPARRIYQLRDLWRSPAPPPSLFAEEIPPALDDLVASLLSMDPMARPTTAAEVIDRLCAIAELPAVDEPGVAQAYLTTPILVGRDGLQLSFRKRMLRALRGQGSSLFVESATGMGRTRMLTRCVLEGKLLGAAVLHVNARECGEGDHAAMRALIRQLFETDPEAAMEYAQPYLGQLARVFPELQDGPTGPSHVEEGPAAASEIPLVQQAICDWLVALAAELLVLVVVDDVEACDPVSAACLAQLAGLARQSRLVVVASSNVEESARAPDIVRRISDTGQRTRLSPLNAEHLLLLLRSVFGAVPNLSVVARWIHSVSRGVPGHAMDLAQHLVNIGAARYEGGSWTLPGDLSGLSLPRSLEQTLQARLDALSEPARLLVEALCLVTGSGPLSVADYLRLLGHRYTAREVFGSLDELVTAEILVSLGDAYTFRQRSLAEAVRRGLSEKDARELHGWLAELYQVRAEPLPSIVAHHLFQAGRPDDAFKGLSADDPGRHDISAPAVLFARSPEGIALYRAAVRWSIEHDEPASRLYARRKVLALLSATTDPSLAVEVKPVVQELLYLSGLDLWDSLDPELDSGTRLGRCLEASKERFEQLPQSQRCVAPERILHELAEVVACLAGACARSWDAEAVRGLPNMVGPLAEFSPAARVLHQITCMVERGLVTGASVVSMRNQLLEQVSSPVDGLPEMLRQGARSYLLYYGGLDQAILGDQLALKHADALEAIPSYAAMAWHVRTVYYLYRGELEATELCRQRKELLALRDVDMDQHLAVGAIFEATVHEATGDLLGVKRLLAQFEREAGRFPGWGPWAALVRASYLRMRGDLAESLAVVEKTLGHMPMLGHGAFIHLTVMRIGTMSMLGEAEDAIKVGAELEGALAERGLSPGEPAAVHNAIAFAELAAGHVERAQERVDGLLSMLEPRSSPCLLRGHAQETRARIALSRGDRAAFREAAECVAAEYRPGRHPGLQARYERLLHEARSRSHDVSPTLSRAAVDEALGTQSERIALATSVRTLFGECRTASERAVQALDVLLQRSGAPGGYLFGIERGSLPLLASKSVPTPGLELLRALIEAVEAARFGDEEEDVTETVEEEGTVTNAPALVCLDTEEGAFQLLMLRSYSMGNVALMGVAALPLADGHGYLVPWELLEAVSDGLLAVGSAASE